MGRPMDGRFCLRGLIQESQRHVGVGKLGEVFLDLLAKEDAHEQQAKAYESKKPHGFMNLGAALSVSKAGGAGAA